MVVLEAPGVGSEERAQEEIPRVSDHSPVSLLPPTVPPFPPFFFLPPQPLFFKTNPPI